MAAVDEVVEEVEGVEPKTVDGPLGFVMFRTVALVLHFPNHSYILV